MGATLTPADAEGGALRSQDLRTSGDPVTLDGTIIRVDPATGAGLPTNPFAGYSDANARRIVAHGLRNPFRFTFRPGTNELWIGDVGWGDWEEINRIVSPHRRVVENFGWPCYEGRPASPDTTPRTSRSARPLHRAERRHEAVLRVPPRDKVVPGETCPTGSSSIAGMAFEFAPNGSTFPAAYQGALFFADYSRDCIWAMKKGGNPIPSPDRSRPSPPEPRTRSTSSSARTATSTTSTSTVERSGGSATSTSNQPPTAVATASPTSGTAPLPVNFDGRGSSDPEGPVTLRMGPRW